MRQDENESEKGAFVWSHTLDLFSSCLIALRKMLVNHTRVKGHKFIEAAVIYTLVQFSNIIYLILEKIVNFLNSFEKLTFAAGIYTTDINRTKLYFLLSAI